MTKATNIGQLDTPLVKPVTNETPDATPKWEPPAFGGYKVEPEVIARAEAKRAEPRRGTPTPVLRTFEVAGVSKAERLEKARAVLNGKVEEEEQEDLPRGQRQGLVEGRGGRGWQPGHGPDSGRACCRQLTCYDAQRPQAVLWKGVQAGEEVHPRMCRCEGCRPAKVGARR